MRRGSPAAAATAATCGFARANRSRPWLKRGRDRSTTGCGLLLSLLLLLLLLQLMPLLLLSAESRLLLLYRQLLFMTAAAADSC